MKKFNYALLVLVFGFAVFAGAANLGSSHSLTAFAGNAKSNALSTDAPVLTDGDVPMIAAEVPTDIDNGQQDVVIDTSIVNESTTVDLSTPSVEDTTSPVTTDPATDDAATSTGTGSITVCKIIQNVRGEIVGGGEKSTSRFTVPFVDADYEGPATGVPERAVFTPPLNLETIFGDVKGECKTYKHLEFGTYYYGEEKIVSDDKWQVPLYDDQSDTLADSLSDFHPFNPDSDPANKNFDGVINLNAKNVDRTLLVLNRHKIEDCTKEDGNCPPDDITIKADKVICDDESDLPNWGMGAPEITATTAETFLSTHPNCHEVKDWTFEWAPYGTVNPGDDRDEGGEGWTAFSGNTDIKAVKNQNQIWVREQSKDEFVGYSGWLASESNPTPTKQDEHTAEMYCYNDGLNYDNFDAVIAPVAGNIYHCISFNARKAMGPDDITIKADKIICDDESDLPNWGLGAPEITATTEQTFLSTHPNCQRANDQTFEWAQYGIVNPGDDRDEGGEGWTAFSGDAIIKTVKNQNQIWVRQQSFKDGFIGYSGWLASESNPTPTKQDEHTAEMYCYNDGLNYDNFDAVIAPVAGNAYHCISFNARKAMDQGQDGPKADAGVDQTIILPTSSTVLDGSGSSDSDGKIKSYVWTFVSGPSTIDPEDVVSPKIKDLIKGVYVFELKVTDNDGATSKDQVSVTVEKQGGGGNNKPACSDKTDNDGDTLIDALDPGCHSDSNASNPDSYVPKDNDETDVPQCSNTVDDDNDSLVDANDPGCHTDGDAGNTNSYDPNDNNETDEDNGGGSGGGSSHHSSSHHASSSRPIGQVLGADGTCGIYVDKYLRVGYANNVDSVKEVQQFLNDYMQAGLKVDGVYGKQTEAAVKAFQLAHADDVLSPWGIDHQATGIFYLTTQTKVNNIMCPTLNLPIPSLINFSQNPNTPAPVHSTAVATHPSSSTGTTGVNI